MLAGIPYGSGKKTLGEQAYESIREAILSLQLKPGQIVYESNFTRILHMSRTPIREAIRALVIEQFIEVLPQRGMNISLISQRRAEETRFVRESLEVSAIQEIVRQMDMGSTEAIQLQVDIESCLNVQRQAAEGNDVLQFLESDDQFHRTFLQYFGNETLTAMVSQIRGHLYRVRMLSLYDVPAMQALILEHQQIAEAIFAKDIQTATDALRAHLRRVTQDIGSMKATYPDYFTY